MSEKNQDNLNIAANPKTLATFDTKNTRRRQKKTNFTQHNTETEKMSNTGGEPKCLLFLRHSSCYSYGQFR